MSISTWKAILALPRNDDSLGHLYFHITNALNVQVVLATSIFMAYQIILEHYILLHFQGHFFYSFFMFRESKLSFSLKFPCIGSRQFYLGFKITEFNGISFL